MEIQVSKDQLVEATTDDFADRLIERLRNHR
jgi:hypothetical protein